MRNNYIKKGFVVGIIFLFIGVGIQPALAKVEQEQSDKHVLVSQLKVVIDEILQKYGNIPLISNLCNIIFNIMDLFDGLIKTICALLLIIIIPVILLLLILKWITWLIDPAISNSISMLITIIAYTWDSKCASYFNFKSLLPLIYPISKSETTDIASLIKDCPCKQE